VTSKRMLWSKLFSRSTTASRWRKGARMNMRWFRWQDVAGKALRPWWIVVCRIRSAFMPVQVNVCGWF
jgi:hypothetical protein